MQVSNDKEEEINKLKNTIKQWIIRSNENLTIPNNIIALNYGIQRVCTGYEIYLSGHDEYCEDHDTWLLDSSFEIEESFFSLGGESLKIGRLEMMDIYRNMIIHLINSHQLKYPTNIKVISVCDSNGYPELVQNKI
ncbi:hypothetical protein [Aureibacter tunicatorum]|uniref:Uncharacterized protein n=1 Tax=Aureibacter tunicatorum TaxID=866807 RepID=A0AAE4BPE4_9BACT|nr:hypothetical protein [Aureibacter tunicatorum]MDR6237894.1 hypothetical protein [Aureibacter tunicatorum]BDD02927.1 hypothetical protein AUTU_04100 [Aureibacter tunicatorum]